jgi:hypothetical protein
MSKIHELVRNLDEKELSTLKQELSTGFLHEYVTQCIRARENIPQYVCAGCNREITTQDSIFVLTFGQQDFRKKATFCATDCLQYFVSGLGNLKKNKKGGRK